MAEPRASQARMSVERIEATPASGQIGIVHLGLGAFHRAHQAVYLERYRKRSADTSWAVSSANLRTGVALVDEMHEAGHRYHVAEYADRETLTLRQVGVIEETLFSGRDGQQQWGRDLDRLLARMADADTRIVTLTVTEKGYFLNPASGELLLDDPMIQADIATPTRPRTAPGLLVEALAQRKARNTAPFTVLCCDNMPDNGQRTRQAVIQLARQRDVSLAEWIAEQVAFPCSMVDRIVPAMTPADFEAIKALGIEDANAVVCEAFSQWVVEDHFPLGRPQWEEEGVTMVADVAPFETMKLRMLNGSHSLLAYLGALDDIDTVVDAVQRDDIKALLRRYMRDEAAPTLDMPEGVDLNAYADSLLARFANDSLRHKLQQIAMDGSQKLPQRWLSAAQINLEARRDASCAALGFAAWVRYTAGHTLSNQPYSVDDPMAAHFAELHRRFAHDESALIEAFLAIEAVVPAALVRHEGFTARVLASYQRLTRQGLAAALNELMHRA